MSASMKFQSLFNRNDMDCQAPRNVSPRSASRPHRFWISSQKPHVAFPAHEASDGNKLSPIFSSVSPEAHVGPVPFNCCMTSRQAKSGVLKQKQPH
jgi:hypothetical protein